MTGPGRALIALLLSTAVACSASGSPTVSENPGPEEPPPTAAGQEGEPRLGPFARAACDLPARYVQRVWAGTHPTRSGQIQFVPQEPNFLGDWYSHSGPWDYLQDVPLFLYGPGHVPALGSVERRVTLADVAPTMAEYLEFDFQAPDGRLLKEAILPADEREGPPRLILVVVWDGGGRNLLETYPNASPNIDRLIPEGVWYERATLGASPSITPPIHATIGTGAWPRRHGLVDLRFLVEGRMVPASEKGPQFFLLPTLADEYDRALDNEPLVGVLAGETWHLTMMGHGSYLEGADKDLAALRKESDWAVVGENEKYYEFPAYLNDVPGLEEAIRRLDLEDGRLDDTWLGERMLDEPRGPTMTPAFAEYQTALLEEMIRREGFGGDDVPDLLFTNYKEIDKVAHRWTMNSPQMEAVVRADDATLPVLIDILNREVGRDEWVMLLTADHGETPKPEVSGAFLMDHEALKADVRAAFDDDGDERAAFPSFRVSQAWVDEDELRENGFSVADVARFIANYTKAQNVADPESLPERERDERLFAAAFPSEVLERNLPCLPGARAG